MFAVHCGPAVEIQGAAPATFRSSEWAERGFCPACGTHLFYRLRASGEYILPAGLFQDAEFLMSSEIFIDEKPGFYEFRNDTEKLTGQQVFEKFAPAS